MALGAWRYRNSAIGGAEGEEAQLFAYIVAALAHWMEWIDVRIDVNDVAMCCRSSMPSGERAKMTSVIGWFPFYASQPVTQYLCFSHRRTALKLAFMYKGENFQRMVLIRTPPPPEYSNK